MTVKKRILWTLLIILVIIAVIGVGLLSCLLINKNNINLTINVDDKLQSIEGFGASSCWTFQDLGAIDDEETQDEIIDLLYGDNGMELSIFRYNIGGGSKDIKDLLPYSDEGRMSESFFIADNYVNAESFSDVNNYDFTKDADVQKMLKKCVDTGNLTKILLFSNSPHYLMTESGMTTGAVEKQNNLKPEFYKAFSQYELIITNYYYQTFFKDLETVPDIYISPVNEPQWKWGGPNASQEGCHFDPEPLAAFYDVFYEELQKFNQENNTNFKMDIFECGNYITSEKHPNVKDYYNEFAKHDWFDSIETISVHSYGANDSIIKRASFKNFLDKKGYSDNHGLSVSEYCEMEWGRDTSIDSGLLLGRVILRDLDMLNVSDWSWWLAVSRGDYNDGLVYWDYNEQDGTSQISMLKRYYVMSHFSKYLEKGDVHLSIKSSETLNLASLDYCAFEKADGSIVLTIINSSNGNRNITLSNNYSTMEIISTNADENLANKGVSDFENRILIPAKTVMTVILR